MKDYQIFKNQCEWNDNTETLICPVCGYDCIHYNEPILVDGKDSYEAWGGRGDCLRIPMLGECGSKFDLCFGYHKGQTFFFVDIKVSCKEQIELESPIEEMFWNEALTRIYGIVPQYEIGPYRVDFAVPDKKVAIELDGHDYHKTKEQRTNDAQRERYLELDGWRVIRFTGTEIYQDVEKCINQAIELIEKCSAEK